MASEALLRSGGSVGEAQDYYARVVKRAMGDDYKVPTVSLDNIYKERRYEFAMEGIRYWDLVRTNQAKDFYQRLGMIQRNTCRFLSRRLISRMAIWYRILISKN